ncbi:MAG: hypothetical protein ACK53L_08770, partial [Pirellulaceae bacterium]
MLPEEADIGFLWSRIRNNGIRVTSNRDYAVNGLNWKPFTTDAYLGLPKDVLGTDYIILGWKNSNGLYDLMTQFAFVATENNTVVSITPTEDIAPVPATLTEPAIPGRPKDV